MRLMKVITFCKYLLITTTCVKKKFVKFVQLYDKLFFISKNNTYKKLRIYFSTILNLEKKLKQFKMSINEPKYFDSYIISRKC